MGRPDTFFTPPPPLPTELYWTPLPSQLNYAGPPPPNQIRYDTPLSNYYFCTPIELIICTPQLFFVPLPIKIFFSNKYVDLHYYAS